MNTHITALPTCDDSDRLEQQHDIQPDPDTPTRIRPRFDADDYDLIDQAIPEPVPDEDYPPDTGTPHPPHAATSNPAARTGG